MRDKSGGNTSANDGQTNSRKATRDQAPAPVVTSKTPADKPPEKNVIAENEATTSQANESNKPSLAPTKLERPINGRPTPGRALIVGIDSYTAFPPLSGCVNDAKSMYDVLQCHDDGSPNFDCRLLTSEHEPVTRARLRRLWVELFSNYDGDIVFYFAGHGTPSAAGAMLVTQDGKPDDEGLPMDELLTLANHAHRARSVLLILDCCHSGTLGTPSLFEPNPTHPDVALLSSGVTILAAARPDQEAFEKNNKGIFTELLVGGLKGAAADTLGFVSPASLYAFVDQACGPWDQRPLFKSNVQNVRPVRHCEPPITTAEIRLLTDSRMFPTEHHRHQLRPSYEYTRDDAVPEDVEKFDYLKLLRDAGLLETGGEDLFWLAVGHRPEDLDPNVKWEGVAVNTLPDPLGEVWLSPLGRSYWRLVDQGKI